MTDLHALPDDLPVPVDDGAADHLPGAELPPLPLLADPALTLAAALALPTFTAAGRRLYRHLTLIVRDGRVEHVFYPVFPPDTHAQEVLAWLRAHPR